MTAYQLKTGGYIIVDGGAIPPVDSTPASVEDALAYAEEQDQVRRKRHEESNKKTEARTNQRKQILKRLGVTEAELEVFN